MDERFFYDMHPDWIKHNTSQEKKNDFQLQTTSTTPQRILGFFY